MHYRTWLLTLAATLATAKDLDIDDYPSACSAACAPVASQVNTCDAGNDNDGMATLACVCRVPDMLVKIDSCNACLEPFRGQPEVDDDEDVNDDDIPDVDDGIDDDLDDMDKRQADIETYSEMAVLQQLCSSDVRAVVSSAATTHTRSSTSSTTRVRAPAPTDDENIGEDRSGDDFDTQTTSSTVASATGNVAVATAAPMLGAGALAIMAAAVVL